MCKESTELTVMRMAELLHPPVKQVNVHHLTHRCCCSCLCFVQLKATGLHWSGAMKSIKEEQQLISIKKVSSFYCNCCLSYDLLSNVKQATCCTVGVSVKIVVWPHLLPMAIILDPEGPTLPLPKFTIVTT